MESPGRNCIAVKSPRRNHVTVEGSFRNNITVKGASWYHVTSERGLNGFCFHNLPFSNRKQPAEEVAKPKAQFQDFH
jgi:hypothetical protein